jgi:hypothetical protein
MRNAKPATVGALIDQMWELREAKRQNEVKTKELTEQIDTLELQLITAMDGEGVLKSTGRKASAGIGEAVRPTIKDDTAFFAYIKKHNYFHLLERRPSVSGCRELLETKGAVPGIEFYVKRTINLKTV